VIEGLLAILRAAGFSDQLAAWAVDRFPVIASMADTIVADSDECFEFGVELLLDGLTAPPPG
jgi:Tetracyclin repressor-like, C-terminal domain